ncbi:MAG TPA: 3-oxoacyl-[acyl-carrier-protein] synthase III C-terminal domain-containing protein, partial [Pirellulaceae bacterium]|nr:3-oxoacyl-[acyl-carrier-protein] synthase III C-terminal domain-containing protein [Pirellulaceae bacterium]
MKCYLTRTASFLPGQPIGNDALHRYIGTVEGEETVKRQVLAANGIKTRYYALNEDQTATHDVYQLAARAIEGCLADMEMEQPVTYLSAGSTYTPLSGPGISSVLHGALAQRAIANYPLEVNSNSGICTSAATALINACRAIRTGDHVSAICVGTEHASEILKSTAICPPQDTEMMRRDLKQSRWFMSVFLRFMLSDGAGACLLQNQPAPIGMSFRMDWVFSQSFAHEAPLCMKLENRTALLSQDVGILSKYLFTCAEKFVGEALGRHGESLDEYRVILPHVSSFFFLRKMEKLIRKFTRAADKTVEYWTNLASVGNTGAASIFIMLDEYLRKHSLRHDDRILLFIPESGQFNFVLI